MTLAEVRALDAGSWFDPEFAGTQVPTLAEFLDVLAASGHRAIVELKGVWDAEAVAAAIGEVAARDLERRVAIASFDARTLAHVSAASEIVPRLLILKHVPDDVVRAAAEAGVRGILVDRKAVLARPEIVDEVHARRRAHRRLHAQPGLAVGRGHRARRRRHRHGRPGHSLAVAAGHGRRGRLTRRGAAARPLLPRRPRS